MQTLFEQLAAIFGRCSHQRTTWPQTPVRRTQFGTHATGSPTVVCLECGKRFSYAIGVGRGPEITGDEVEVRTAEAQAR